MHKNEKTTILVVDDAPMVLGMIKRILSSRGYRLLLASNGAEALELAKKSDGEIDLLLTDVVMPGITGLDLAREFIKTYPKTEIMFMSGHVDPSVIRQHALFDKTTFFSKPFTPSRLVAKIRSILEPDYVPEIDDESQEKINEGQAKTQRF